MSRSRRRLPTAVASLLLTAGLAGCGEDSSDADEAGRTSASPATLTVFAAASLTGAFEQLGQEFEATRDHVEVKFGFAGSSDLAAQIRQGAPADVFASADGANMEKLTAENLVDSPRPFATNTLEIAVPPDNPAGVESLQDLTESGLNLVVCAPEVPCGAASHKVAESAGVTLQPVSEEQSVTDVLNKVRSGEADAGLVYVTDVRVAGDAVAGIAFPEAADVVNAYPIATIADSADTELAREFVDFVLGEDGQAVLGAFGFGQPDLHLSP